MEERNTRVIKDWPLQNPVLNPIKNLWDYVNRKLPHYNFSNVNRQEIWLNIDSDTIKKLVDSMHNRILHVQKSKSGNTKY